MDFRYAHLKIVMVVENDIFQKSKKVTFWGVTNQYIGRLSA